MQRKKYSIKRNNTGLDEKSTLHNSDSAYKTSPSLCNFLHKSTELFQYLSATAITDQIDKISPMTKVIWRIEHVMVHLGGILVLFVFPLINGIDGEKLPDNFHHIMERLTDLENRLHLQEEKNVDLEKRLSDQEKLNAIQTQIIQELTTCDCTFKEKETPLSSGNRYIITQELMKIEAFVWTYITIILENNIMLLLV